jgi:hypothetical protein
MRIGTKRRGIEIGFSTEGIVTLGVYYRIAEHKIPAVEWQRLQLNGSASRSKRWGMFERSTTFQTRERFDGRK